MTIILAVVVAVIFILAGAIYAFAKKLNVEKLFGQSILSLIVLTIFFTGLTIFHFDVDISQFNQVNKAETELEPEPEPMLFPEEEPFAVMLNPFDTFFFPSFAEAVTIAKEFGKKVYFQDLETTVWDRTSQIPEKVIQAPLYLQLPELPRGCEVTSLAMMLNYKGVKVGKMELAQNVRKDPTPYREENGQIFFGNPYDGFVGDMYSFDNPGYGVYHGPIRDLAEKYIPNQVVDMTGAEFEEILYPIHEGRPVWVIVHTQYKTLPESSFQTWQTPNGEIKITYHQHSVLITGYDEENIYFNDPRSSEVNRPITKERFKDAWEQMGKQAISYVD